MKRYAYRQNGLSGEVFLEPTATDPKVALFCFGFPGNMGANPTVEFLVDMGYAVMVHQYSGTYDSEGDFTVASSIQSTVAIANRVAAGAFTEIKTGKEILLGRAPRVSLIAGHSFGCFIGGRAATKIPSVSTVLLLAPVLGCGHGPIDYGVLEDGIAQLDYVRRARPYTYRFGDVEGWQSLFKGERDQWDPTGSEVTRALGIVGGRDTDLQATLLANTFQSIVSSVLGSRVTASIRVVNSAGHGDGELLDEESRRWILTQLP